MPHRPLLASALALAAGPLAAQQADPLALDPLTVTSSRAPSEWLTLPLAIGTRDSAEQPGEQLLSLDSLLAPIPGTVSQSRYKQAQGMRLSIRGFGARIRLVSHEQGGFVGSISLAEEAAADPLQAASRAGAVFLPRQFSNVDNTESHVVSTGPEIW